MTLRQFKSVQFKSVVRLCIFVCASASGATVVAQALPAGVTPQMAQQFQSMSPAQQQALAQQYGVTLPGSAPQQTEQVSGLGDAGEQLEQSDAASEEADESDLAEATASAATQQLSRYGRSLFNREVSTFSPTDDALVPDEYRLGVGDQLVVQLFGKENATYNLSVGRDGNISFIDSCYLFFYWRAT